jgi:3-phytase
MRARAVLAIMLATGLAAGTTATAQPVLTPRVTLVHNGADDQDDLCVWLHPGDRTQSVVVAADKAANRLFVYDLAGALLQTVPVSGQPGNIDIRYGVPVGAGFADVVVFNDRQGPGLQAFTVSPVTRTLTRIDGGIPTGSNYGSCLYRSPATGAYYAFTTAENGVVTQYALDGSTGVLAAAAVRTFDLGSRIEGCVCDDETGRAYFGEEAAGIWTLGAEPGDPVTPVRLASVGDASGLVADVEGLTIYYARDGGGYLIASSQGNHSYKVYDRRPPHGFLRSFSISGVQGTDGIDVVSANLGGPFTTGLFAAHNGAPSRKPVVLCAFGDVGLPLDSGYWDPRAGGEDTTVVVPDPRPVPHGWSLAGARPNPVRDALVVAFSVPSAGPVDLELYDLAGRRAWSRRLDLAAGAHVAHLGDARALAPGVYTLRLVRGEAALARRVVVTR